ncbi:hypothetical protein PR048_007100 [Dryococelus australis]|uniref:Uncharacterized protein n=1 Tax=Dryococelus australis TaxID=614101 RepID=A0ABQ9ICQ6_9NEOP|nr:hypothetical protein PR048_007100 [Dryococelus australis]
MTFGVLQTPSSSECGAVEGLNGVLGLATLMDVCGPGEKKGAKRRGWRGVPVDELGVGAVPTVEAISRAASQRVCGHVVGGGAPQVRVSSSPLVEVTSAVEGRVIVGWSATHAPATTLLRRCLLFLPHRLALIYIVYSLAGLGGDSRAQKSVGTISGVEKFGAVPGRCDSVRQKRGGGENDEVSIEQRLNERESGTGNPRKKPPTNGIVRHDSHVRKYGVTRPGIEPRSPWWKASRLTAQPPDPAVNRTRFASVGGWRSSSCATNLLGDAAWHGLYKALKITLDTIQDVFPVGVRSHDLAGWQASSSPWSVHPNTLSQFWSGGPVSCLVGTGLQEGAVLRWLPFRSSTSEQKGAILLQSSLMCQDSAEVTPMPLLIITPSPHTPSELIPSSDSKLSTSILPKCPLYLSCSNTKPPNHTRSKTIYVTAPTPHTTAYFLLPTRQHLYLV